MNPKTNLLNARIKHFLIYPQVMKDISIHLAFSILLENPSLIFSLTVEIPCLGNTNDLPFLSLSSPVQLEASLPLFQSSCILYSTNTDNSNILSKLCGCVGTQCLIRTAHLLIGCWTTVFVYQTYYVLITQVTQ